MNQPYYGWGPPPMYGPPQYIPVPQGVDAERMFKIYERLQRREDKKKKKEDEEKKKKDDGNKNKKPPLLSFAQHLSVLTVFGFPVGLLWIILMKSLLNTVHTAINTAVQ